MNFRRHRVTVEVALPREDWLTRLVELESGCVQCGGTLPEPPIYLNTEGPDGGNEDSDLLCSWGCVLELAAGVVLVDEEIGPRTSIVEVDDWRGEAVE